MGKNHKGASIKFKPLSILAVCYFILLTTAAYTPETNSLTTLWSVAEHLSKLLTPARAESRPR